MNHEEEGKKPDCATCSGLLRYHFGICLPLISLTHLCGVHFRLYVCAFLLISIPARAVEFKTVTLLTLACSILDVVSKMPALQGGCNASCGAL